MRWVEAHAARFTRPNPCKQLFGTLRPRANRQKRAHAPTMRTDEGKSRFRTEQRLKFIWTKSTSTCSLRVGCPMVPVPPRVSGVHGCEGVCVVSMRCLQPKH